MRPIVVMHEPGANGGPWRDALRAWSDATFAPDLVLEGASGDRTDVVWLVLEQMETWRDQRPVVVGCGDHGLAAETFALAGWAGGLVLVDALGGAWTTPREQVRAQNEWLRAKFDDPTLVGFAPVWIESFSRTMRAHEGCPALVIETPTSITSPDQVEIRAAQFAGPVEVVHLGGADPAVVVPAIAAWVGS